MTYVIDVTKWDEQRVIRCANDLDRAIVRDKPRDIELGFELLHKVEHEHPSRYLQAKAYEWLAYFESKVL